MIYENDEFDDYQHARDGQKIGMGCAGVVSAFVVCVVFWGGVYFVLKGILAWFATT